MDHLRAQGAPDYIAGITDDPDEAPEAVAPGERDELFDAAVEIVARAGKASTSMIQRHLKIGYNRAARIIEEMEAAGVVGPADGVRPRDVLVDPQ
jgi:S-DNA-T family DNA segregation ATPase FtsK/SpoIIIE